MLGQVALLYALCEFEISFIKCPGKVSSTITIFCFSFEIDINDLFSSSSKKLRDKSLQLNVVRPCENLRGVTEIKFTVLTFETQEKETKVRQPKKCLLF